MAKRAAEEYITKEHGSTPNYTDIRHTKDANMSTPAEIARRRLKTPKSRLGAARINSSAGSVFNSTTAPNPFAQSQQQAFPPINGFTFGQQQSQSFPPGPNPPSSAFNFSAGSQSFAFGDQSQQSASSTNPFAFGSANNPNNTQPATNAFGMSTQTNGATNAPSTLFGSNQNTSQTNGLGTSTNTPFSFTAPPSTQPEQPSNPFSFSQNTSQANGQITSNPFVFGQGTSQTTESSTKAPNFGFGQGGSQPNTQTSQASSPFIFGQSTAKASGQSTPGTGLFNFGGQSPSNVNEQSKAGTNLFNFASSTSQPATSNIFGQSGSQAPSASMFGSPQSNSLFGQNPTSTASTQQSQPTHEPNTDDTIMLSPPRKEPAAAPLSNHNENGQGLTTDSTPPKKSLFGHTLPPNFSLSTPSPIKSPATTQNSLFARMGEAPTTAFTAPVAPNDVRSSADPEPAPSQASALSSASEPLPASQLAPAPLPAPASQSTPAPKPEPAPKSLFQGPLPAFESTATTQASELAPASKSLFQSPSSAIPKAPVGTPATAEASPPKQPMSASDKGPTDLVKVKLRSNGPSEPLVTDDHTKWSEHDRKYRLRSLNKELVRCLGQCDPSGQDFDNVILFYYQTRERLGLMWPSGTQTTKRKAADDDDMRVERASPAKKTKPNEGTTGQIGASDGKNIDPAIGFSAPGSVFSNIDSGDVHNSIEGLGQANPTPSSTLKQSALFTPKNGPSNGTSNLFQNMLSKPTESMEPTKPKNPFSNIPSQPQSSAKPGFSFSQAPSTGLAAPAQPNPQLSSHGSSEDDDADDDEQQDSDYVPEQSEGDVTQSPEDEGDDDSDSDSQEEDDMNEEGEGENVSTEEDDQKAPLAKPENLGKSLFDRIQTPPINNSEPAAPTPNGSQAKETLKQPAPNHSFKPYTPFAPGFAKSTPQAPTVSPFTPVTSTKSKPQSTFEFNPKPAATTPTPVPGASIFAGGAIKSNGPIPGEGLFGSRPSTPTNVDSRPTNAFAGFAKTANAAVEPLKDHTWTKGSPLKFDSSKSQIEQPKFAAVPATNFMKAFGGQAESQAALEKKRKRDEDIGSDAEDDEKEEWDRKYDEEQQAKRSKLGQGGFSFTPNPPKESAESKMSPTPPPSFNITAATPPPKSTATSELFSNLFGQKPSATSTAEDSPAVVGWTFGPSTSSEGETGVGPIRLSSLQPAASYLFPSGNTSGFSSRATSPGATDNESVDTNGEADEQNDPQASLMSDRPGEEGELVLYECRAKGLKYYDKDMAAKIKGSTPNSFNSIGLGMLRVLKNEETGKSRIVFRAEPGANILLNTNLSSQVSYVNDSRAKGSGVVRFGVPIENGKIESWVLKVKDSTKAADLADVLTQNKPSS